MKIIRKSLLAIGVVFLSMGMFAQSVEDAGAKYNEGNEAMKAKQYSTAVSAFEDALKMAQAAGPDAADLEANVEKQLMQAYYRNGIAKYKGKKYDASVAEMDKSLGIANKIGDTDMANKLTVTMAKVLSSKGMSLIKKKDLDGAYATFEEAHKVKSTCVISYYGKGLVWKERGDMGKMMTNMDKAIELGASEPKMDKYVTKAKSAASKGLVAEATQEITKEHGNIAARYLNDSFKYKAGNADTYYYLTIAYNKSNEFNNAVEAANKAISMKEGDKSDIYFELGMALTGKGDSDGACGAFKKVTGGANAEAAKYQIDQVLKCG
jgi:tetratricopeptide (TPR) repeat protein